MWLLTLYWQGDGLAGLVLSILVIYSLHIVASGIRCHSRQDNQRVVQSNGTEQEKKRKEVNALDIKSLCSFNEEEEKNFDIYIRKSETFIESFYKKKNRENFKAVSLCLIKTKHVWRLLLCPHFISWLRKALNILTF